MVSFLTTSSNETLLHNLGFSLLLLLSPFLDIFNDYTPAFEASLFPSLFLWFLFFCSDFFISKFKFFSHFSFSAFIPPLQALKAGESVFYVFIFVRFQIRLLWFYFCVFACLCCFVSTANAFHLNRSGKNSNCDHSYGGLDSYTVASIVVPRGESTPASSIGTWRLSHPCVYSFKLLQHLNRSFCGFCQFLFLLLVCLGAREGCFSLFGTWC